MQDEDIVSIYMTTDSEDVAIHIVTTLVNEGLIACANIMGDTRSIYRWKDVVRLEREITVLMKTVRGQADAVIARASELHTYDVPCILVTPVIGGYDDYMDWIRKQTGFAPAEA